MHTLHRLKLAEALPHAPAKKLDAGGGVLVELPRGRVARQLLLHPNRRTILIPILRRRPQEGFLLCPCRATKAPQ